MLIPREKLVVGFTFLNKLLQKIILFSITDVPWRPQPE